MRTLAQLHSPSSSSWRLSDKWRSMTAFMEKREGRIENMWELSSPAGWRCKGIQRCSREVKLSPSLMRFRGSRKTWIFTQAWHEEPWRRNKENKVIFAGIKLSITLNLKYILHVFVVSRFQRACFPFTETSWLQFKTAAQQKPQCVAGM